MQQIEIDKLNKHFGDFHALHDIELAVPKGAFVALVGPSGCGKSTLLRTIAGLEKASSGAVRIAGDDVTHSPPRQRDVAMVFQSYALYPHMTVEKNMNFSMRIKRMEKSRIEAATREAAGTLGLEALLGRMPRALSGGQRQRVAMGRAIVRDPKVFLFDEPLSNLDAALRVRMRGEIRKLHERLGATSIYVTHDQVEAMTMADHIVVLRSGCIEQQGRPLELYDRPVNRFVGSFIGSPAMNFIAAVSGPGGLSVRLDRRQTLPVAADVEAGRDVLVGLRPEQISFVERPNCIGLPATVDTVESTGSMTYVNATAGPETLVIAQAGRPTVERGEDVMLYVAREDVRLFDATSEKRLSVSRPDPGEVAKKR
ncbi:ABC transporter ATP-binding protein [Salinisphaera sp. LB1]|uniref:ABC transporter ATP-binding protein n=1 Tax=Salinisphaera sp. LB1 TaxID=2183911 RepID=UPI000D708060|nr:sn-glycerol-3-phosphate ABC transporter ATP-binding protein UgpC [Salinisphaera sp. LB1]AWN16233.1 Maltose maltodextrin transport ATP-binding protein malK [Salinisphaera sp. LB1]